MKTGYSLLVAVLLIISCDKDDNDIELQLDKQISFQLFFSQAWGDTIWTNPYDRYDHCLKNFKKSNYPDINSIIISVPMCSYTTNAICYVDLFNLTDSVSIENSQLETNTYGMIYIESPNIIDEIPNKTIDLALRIKSSEYAGLYDINVGVGDISYLFLNR